MEKHICYGKPYTLWENLHTVDSPTYYMKEFKVQGETSRKLFQKRGLISVSHRIF